MPNFTEVSAENLEFEHFSTLSQKKVESTVLGAIVSPYASISTIFYSFLLIKEIFLQFLLIQEMFHLQFVVDPRNF